MSDDREYVQPASSTYEDWKGTAVAENDIVKGKDLYELAGLDHSNWSILGMDFIGGGAPGWVYVYALDRVKHKVHSHDDLMKLAEKHGRAKRVVFDPEIHGCIEEAEPGSEIWYWGDSLMQNKQAQQAAQITPINDHESDSR